MPERLPKRLFYRWANGAEIEYPTNIPTPTPEIKCDTVQVTVPPSLPAMFSLWGASHPSGAQVLMSSGQFWSQPLISNIFNYPDGIRQEVNFAGLNPLGQVTNGLYLGRIIYANTYFITPGNTQQPRRDLLVGVARITNPTINTPCPTWRITGGNCPPGSIDCGDCCLDCSATKSAIDAVTASILPFSTWGPK